jgi:hypothetical protein
MCSSDRLKSFAVSARSTIVRWVKFQSPLPLRDSARHRTLLHFFVRLGAEAANKRSGELLPVYRLRHLGLVSVENGLDRPSYVFRRRFARQCYVRLACDVEARGRLTEAMKYDSVEEAVSRGDGIWLGPAHVEMLSGTSARYRGSQPDAIAGIAASLIRHC